MISALLEEQQRFNNYYNAQLDVITMSPVIDTGLREWMEEMSVDNFIQANESCGSYSEGAD